jgi:uncharacterized protein (TIGR03067 family)
MRLSLVLILAAGLLYGEIARAQDAKKDQEQLQGTWMMVSREFMGKKASEEEIKKLNTKIVVKGDMITVWSKDAGTDEVVSESTFKVDPTTKPKSLDFTMTSGPSKGQTAVAIYELEGDSLKVCYAVGETKRPTQFAAANDTEWVLLTYKREKK